MWKNRVLQLLSILILCLCITALQACHTIKIEIDSTTTYSKEIEEKNWYFLEGLFPTRVIDVSSKCPAGVAAIKEQTQFSDGFICGITLGIACPRSSWYYCLPEKGAMLKPSDVIQKEKSI